MYKRHMALNGRRWDDGMFAVMEIENTTLKPFKEMQRSLFRSAQRVFVLDAVIWLFILQ